MIRFRSLSLYSVLAVVAALSTMSSVTAAKLNGPITMYCPGDLSCTVSKETVNGLTQGCSSISNSCSNGVCKKEYTLSCDSNYLECDAGCTETPQSGGGGGSTTSTVDTSIPDIPDMDMPDMPGTGVGDESSNESDGLDCDSLLAQFPDCQTCVYKCGDEAAQCATGFAGNCSPTCFGGGGTKSCMANTGGGTGSGDIDLDPIFGDDTTSGATTKSSVMTATAVAITSGFLAFKSQSIFM
mmetsp:Transcript_17074/g.28432  ORF Transcript_17074/g.28432 Transcript_17074/m.28432 type:complete len:240 (-) Transcript_17074:287-1006(-)